MNSVVTIKPGERKGDGPCLTIGTKVLMPDGTEMPGVYRVVLTADVDDVWKAQIHCYARVEDMVAEADITTLDADRRTYAPASRFKAWWRRVWQ